MEQQPIDDEAEVFVFERLVAIHAADGAGFGELVLVAEQVGHVIHSKVARAACSGLSMTAEADEVDE